jgi:acetyl-CoA carboxylase carboxyl transferase subunit alpha
MIDVSNILETIKNKDRPNTQFYINQLFPDFIEMSGDRLYGDDSSISGGIATFNNIPITIIGQNRGRTTNENLKYNFSMSKPEGFRKSLRLMKQAEKFHRPVICFVDTLGAYPGSEAEERGQGFAIANNLMNMLHLKTPIISILIGNGGSGGALALCISDEIAALEYSVLSVISPRACANILWKDSSREIEAASMLKMTSMDLHAIGILDTIIKEPEMGAHTNPEKMAENIRQYLSGVLPEYINLSINDLLKKRKEI